VSALLLLTATALLLSLAAGLLLVMRLPGSVDTVLVALLLGSTAIAVVLALGEALSLPRARDVALCLALLAAVLGVAFVLRGWSGDGVPPPPEES